MAALVKALKRMHQDCKILCIKNDLRRKTTGKIIRTAFDDRDMWMSNRERLISCVESELVGLAMEVTQAFLPGCMIVQAETCE